MGNANPFKRPLLLLVALAAFAASAYGAWVLIENQRKAALAEFGRASSSGQISGGFWWTVDSYTAFVGWPSQPPAYNKPVFMLLLHYPPETPSNNYSHHDTRLSDDDWEIATEATAEFKDGRFKAQYAVSAKDPTEKFLFDGKSYSPDAGRLFLIDLTGPSPTIKQFPADLPALIQNPATASNPTPVDPTPQIRDALNKLREQNPEVRQFLEGSSLK